MCVCCPARRCVIVIAKKSDLSDLHNRAAAVQLSRLVNAITSKSNLSPFFLGDPPKCCSKSHSQCPSPLTFVSQCQMGTIDKSWLISRPEGISLLSIEFPFRYLFEYSSTWDGRIVSFWACLEFVDNLALLHSNLVRLHLTHFLGPSQRILSRQSTRNFDFDLCQ